MAQIAAPTNLLDRIRDIERRLSEMGKRATGSSMVRVALAADQVVYVSPGGDDSSDGLTPLTPKATITSALAVFPTGPLLVKCDYAPHSNPIIGPIDLQDRSNVTIEGFSPGGRNANVGATQANGTVLRIDLVGYSKACVDLRGGRAVTLRGLTVCYSSGSFTGHVVDAAYSPATGARTSQLVIEDCVVTRYTSFLPSAASSVNVAGATDVVLSKSRLMHAMVGLNRADTSGDGLSNLVVLDDVGFAGHILANVNNPDTNYSFKNCSMESLRDGSAASIVGDPDIPIVGMSVENCWFGDVRDPMGGDQISGFFLGATITGNFIATKNGGSCIRPLDGSNGFAVTGNQFYGSGTDAHGVRLDAVGMYGYDVENNNSTNLGPGGLEIYPATARPRVPGRGGSRNNGQPRDRGMEAWSFDPATASGGTTLAVAGRVYVSQIELNGDAPLSQLVFEITAGGSGLTAGQCGACLWRADGTYIGQTGDLSTIFASADVWEPALTGGPFDSTAGIFYFGIWFNGTTGPTLSRKGSSQKLLAYGLTPSTYLAGYVGSGVTAAPPNPMGAIAPQNAWLWAGLK